jgi:transcriptional regulator with XRE-family HTH domain
LVGFLLFNGKCGITLPQDIKPYDMEKFGNYITNLRISRGITLREFCRRNGLDPSNWSKVERSVLAPPKSKITIESILASMGIEKDTEEYNTTIDLGLLESIPEDYIAEKNVLKELPVLFRTVRGKKPSSEDLQKLIEYLKHENE